MVLERARGSSACFLATCTLLNCIGKVCISKKKNDGVLLSYPFIPLYPQPHQDGPAYDARVAIVSLGAPAVMRFYPKRNDDDGAAHAHAPCCSVVLPPGSLLVFTGDAYGRCLHGIDSGAHHVLDDTVVNKADAAAWLDKGLDKGHTHAQQHPHVLRRQGARVSLTFRHVMQAASVSWHTPT